MPGRGPFVIYIDGASKGNPGPAGAAFVVVDAEGRVIHQEKFHLSRATNNYAEYAALIRALLWARPLEEVEIRSDSELLVQQMNGRYRVRDATLAKMRDTALFLLAGKRWKITHIPREENRLADKLAKEASEEDALEP